MVLNFTFGHIRTSLSFYYYVLPNGSKIRGLNFPLFPLSSTFHHQTKIWSSGLFEVDVNLPALANSSYLSLPSTFTKLKLLAYRPDQWTSGFISLHHQHQRWWHWTKIYLRRATAASPLSCVVFFFELPRKIEIESKDASFGMKIVSLKKWTTKLLPCHMELKNSTDCT